MPIELKVPEIGESITEVEIGDWLKNRDDAVQKDEPVATLESEKATVELPAPAAGKIVEILKQKGETAKVGEVIGYLEEDGGQSPKTEVRSPRAEVQSPKSKVQSPEPEVGRERAEDRGQRSEVRGQESEGKSEKSEVRGQKSEVKDQRAEEKESATAVRSVPAEKEEPAAVEQKGEPSSDREEEVVPMSRLRRTVAERLVEAQHTAALLTTFNEIDMSAVVALRKQYGEAFQQKYEAKLGFMSFFVKAAIDALKQFPALNAEVRGTNIVYHNFYDIGIAVGSGKGLVVPVLRNAERMSFAEVEKAIGDFGRRAKENKLKVEELQGGTFTISNGGVYGSLLSTPIINPPQSGVLGLHAIQERPVAHEGTVIIRPMMYVALTYDHRLVDGREAVLFLRRIKESIEVPARMLLEA
jgi:2-oxoglutarate dehydrogenase E2 component (dihydrolipoamide succinyltransferase)